MSNDKNDFFLHSNVVNHISKEDYGKIELLVNAAKAFARSTYQCRADALLYDITLSR